MNPFTTYHIFISSSSDLKQERDEIRKIIEDFTIKTTRSYQIKLEPFMHEHDVEGRLEPGKTPQQIINKDLKKFESGQYKGMYLGMVWKRYGIPVSAKNHRSGTEYELIWGLKQQKKGKIILVKFLVKAVSFDEERDIDQYNKAQYFIENTLKEKGLYKQTFDTTNFTKVLTNELYLALHNHFVPDNINQKTRKLAENLTSANNFFEARPKGEKAISYLERARLALSETKPYNYVVIHGMAGVGKSYLATRLLADFYQGTSSKPNPPAGVFEPNWIWWIDADTHNDPQKVENQLVELARYLGITNTNLNEALVKLSEKLSSDEYSWLLERVGKLKGTGSGVNFVSTKMQCNDQTVEATDRLPVGSNIAFSKPSTQA